MLAHHSYLRGDSLCVLAYELKPGHELAGRAPSVLRYLAKTGEEYGGGAKRMDWYHFILGLAHPVYDILGSLATPRRDPYTFYMRVPEMPAFLCHIAPLLEQRLAESIAVGIAGS